MNLYFKNKIKMLKQKIFKKVIMIKINKIKNSMMYKIYQQVKFINLILKYKKNKFKKIIQYKNPILKMNIRF